MIFLIRLLVILVLLWLAGFLVFLGYAALPAEKVEHETDAVVVLTGDAGRLEAGLAYFKTGAAKHLLITGVNKGTKREEILAPLFEGNNEPGCCITLDREADNTRGNARETHKWIREQKDGTIDSLRLVTSSLHMPRARLEFWAALNNDIDIYDHRVRTRDWSPGNPGFWRMAVLEYLKFWVVLGRIATQDAQIYEQITFNARQWLSEFGLVSPAPQENGER